MHIPKALEKGFQNIYRFGGQGHLKKKLWPAEKKRTRDFPCRFRPNPVIFHGFEARAEDPAEMAGLHERPAAEPPGDVAVGSNAVAPAGSRIQTPELIAKRKLALRFAVGDAVECRTGDGFVPGKVTAHLYRDDFMPPGVTAPYQIQLDNGNLIWAPEDDDKFIRAKDAFFAEKKAKTEA